MKKFIQVISFLSLILVFGGVSANAQSSTTKLDAHIPFDFTVGNSSFSAGKYVLRILSLSSGAQVLEVRNDDNGLVYTGLLASNGDRMKAAVELRFDRAGGQFVLARIVTANAGYSVAIGDYAKLIAAHRKTRTTVDN